MTLTATLKFIIPAVRANPKKKIEGRKEKVLVYTFEVEDGSIIVQTPCNHTFKFTKETLYLADCVIPTLYKGDIFELEINGVKVDYLQFEDSYTSRQNNDVMTQEKLLALLFLHDP